MHRPSWIASTLLGAVALVPFLFAEPAAPRERLSPEGIDGALLLCGDKPPDKALDVFWEQVGEEKAIIAVLFGEKSDADAVAQWADALKARKPARFALMKYVPNDPKLTQYLDVATGIWIVGGTVHSIGSEHSDTAKRFRAVMRRGVVAASGPATREASALLPGAVIDPDFHSGEGEEKLFAALDKTPGSFGVGLEKGTALLIRGREMAVVGDGAATVLLAKSPTKPRRVQQITAGTLSDYTMLRRAAIARAGAPFPPKERVTPEVPKGALVIVGGGGMPADVTKKFIDLAGGPDARIVVLPTASPGAAGDEGGFFKRAGARNVVSLPAVKLADVEDPKNLEILQHADAIWFGGGRQWHFVDAYEGTKAEELFRDVLRRGGVIGGSSAGATIQGDYLCRGSPLNNTDEMCEGYERGFGFLPGVAIDQHFTQRHRFADMTSLMKAYPRLLGIGLDEATAIVVQGHEAAVMGKGVAHFYDGGKSAAEGQPDYDSVKAGGRYDLKARKVLDPG